jgi:hypothetical protein
MPPEESITISAPILRDRDSDIWERIHQPGVDKAGLIRAAIRLLIESEKRQNTFEDEVLGALDEIKGMLLNGGVTVAPSPSQKINDPFLDNSL